MTAPVTTRPKGLWELTKDELLAEAQARGLWVNPKWTVPEIREMIKDDMDHEASATSTTTGALPPGASSMSLAQLMTMAEDLNVKVPAGSTKGAILRLIRDSAGGGHQLVMTFGRYKGYLYTETPMNYRRWAISEATTSKTASEDLIHYADWCKAHLERSTLPRRYVAQDDPELNATVPYIPDESEAVSWELLARESLPVRTLDGGEGKGNCRVSATPPYRMSSEAGSRREMQTDVGPDVLDEICHLETRLAVIRDRHGLPRAPGAGEDNHQ